MLNEQELVFPNTTFENLESIFQDDTIKDKSKTDIHVHYTGDKNEKLYSEILNKSKNPNNEQTDYEENTKNISNNPYNYFLFIKYKDIYIGSVSIFNFNIRQGFGLNKYSENSFYLGQWKNNMKEGIGFLKIDISKMYVGSFHENQFDGFGILYYKHKDLMYFGEFNNGAFDNGIYCNYTKGLFYRGKFTKNKKHDTFCSFLEMNNRHLFIGEVNQDNFIKGYLTIYQISEGMHRNEETNEEEEVINFNIQKLFYYDKSDTSSTLFIHQNEMGEDFLKKVRTAINLLFKADYDIKERIQNNVDYFDYLESLIDDEDYNNLERYYESENSLEKFFMTNYNNYLISYKETQESVDLNEIQKEIGKPVIKKENM